MPTAGTFVSASAATVSYTLAAGSNRIVLVATNTEANPPVTITGVTYSGVAMTQAEQRSYDEGGDTNTGSLWYLLEASLPANGAHTVSVSTSGTQDEIKIAAGQLNDAAQTAPEATAWSFASFTSGGLYPNEPSTQITTLTDGALIVDMVAWGTPAASTPGAGQTELVDLNGVASSALCMSRITQATAGAKTLTWAHGQSTNQVVHILAAFAPSTVPASANAGPDQNVAAGALVTLDASASTVAGGAAVTNGDGTWTQTGGTSVTLSNATDVQPTFTAPSPGTQTTLTFQYAVGGDTDSVSIVVASANTPPTASISVDKATATIGETVTVTLTGSDVDGTIAAYEMTLDAAAAGSLSSTTSSVATWDTTGETAGTYTITGRVQDDDSAWSSVASTAVTLVGAGSAIGDNLDGSHEATLLAGVATVKVIVQVRAIGGGNLPGGTKVRLDKFGALSEGTGGTWRPGGDVNASPAS